MQAEIIQRKENPLLKRVEIQFKIVHHGEGTPTRDTIREEIAKLVKAPRERVVIDHVRSEFGRPHSKGYARVYESKEDALAIEQTHILVRNRLVVEEKKEKKAEPPPGKIGEDDQKEEGEPTPEEEKGE